QFVHHSDQFVEREDPGSTVQQRSLVVAGQQLGDRRATQHASSADPSPPKATGSDTVRIGGYHHHIAADAEPQQDGNCTSAAADTEFSAGQLRAAVDFLSILSEHRLPYAAAISGRWQVEYAALCPGVAA